MYKRFFVYVIFIIFVLNNAVFADIYNTKPIAISDFAEKLPLIKSIKCKFQQEKYIKNIEKPIVSNGDFEFIENKGVYFHTTYPIDSKADYTNKNYKQINDVVKAIQTGKYSAIEKEFQFYMEKPDVNNWIVGMKPNEKSNAARVIENITVFGSDYIEKIIINQKNGNKTVICFTK